MSKLEKLKKSNKNNTLLLGNNSETNNSEINNSEENNSEDKHIYKMNLDDFISKQITPNNLNQQIIIDIQRGYNIKINSTKITNSKLINSQLDKILKNTNTNINITNVKLFLQQSVLYFAAEKILELKNKKILVNNIQLKKDDKIPIKVNIYKENENILCNEIINHNLFYHNIFLCKIITTYNINFNENTIQIILKFKWKSLFLKNLWNMLMDKIVPYNIPEPVLLETENSSLNKNKLKIIINKICEKIFIDNINTNIDKRCEYYYNLLVNKDWTKLDNIYNIISKSNSQLESSCLIACKAICLFFSLIKHSVIILNNYNIVDYFISGLIIKNKISDDFDKDLSVQKFVEYINTVKPRDNINTKTNEPILYNIYEILNKSFSKDINYIPQNFLQKHNLGTNSERYILDINNQEYINKINEIILNIERLYSTSSNKYYTNNNRIKNLLYVIYYRYIYKTRNKEGNENENNKIIESIKSFLQKIENNNIKNIANNSVFKDTYIYIFNNFYKNIYEEIYNYPYNNIIKESINTENALRQGILKLNYFKEAKKLYNFKNNNYTIIIPNNKESEQNIIKNVYSILNNFNILFNNKILLGFNNLSKDINKDIYKILEKIILVYIVYSSIDPTYQLFIMNNKTSDYIKNIINLFKKKYIKYKFKASNVQFKKDATFILKNSTFFRNRNLDEKQISAIINYKYNITEISKFNNQYYNEKSFEIFKDYIKLIIYMIQRSIIMYYLNEIIKITIINKLTIKDTIFQVFYIIYNNIILKLEEKDIYNGEQKQRIKLSLDYIYEKLNILQNSHDDDDDNLKNIFFNILEQLLMNIFVSNDQISCDKITKNKNKNKVSSSIPFYIF